MILWLISSLGMLSYVPMIQDAKFAGVEWKQYDMFYFLNPNDSSSVGAFFCSYTYSRFLNIFTRERGLDVPFDWA